MYKYKINNSYTVYVPNDSDQTDNGEVLTKEFISLEWVVGAKVHNYFHGKGKITSIDDKNITVHFYGIKNQTIGKKGKKRASPFIITYSKEDAYKDLHLVEK